MIAGRGVFVCRSLQVSCTASSRELKDASDEQRFMGRQEKELTDPGPVEKAGWKKRSRR